MGPYKRVFDSLDLEIIDLVYEAALVQLLWLFRHRQQPGGG